MIIENDDCGRAAIDQNIRDAYVRLEKYNIHKEDLNKIHENCEKIINISLLLLQVKDEKQKVADISRFVYSTYLDQLIGDIVSYKKQHNICAKPGLEIEVTLLSPREICEFHEIYFYPEENEIYKPEIPELIRARK
jgi:hypothetical protein